MGFQFQIHKEKQFKEAVEYILSRNRVTHAQTEMKRKLQIQQDKQWYGDRDNDDSPPPSPPHAHTHTHTRSKLSPEA